MRIQSKKAYTFIELTVVLTIISILSIMTYVPYSFYRNKEKLRSSRKEIAQSIAEARNLAINGLSNSNSNVSIGLYFDSTLGNKIEFFSYPFDYTGSLKTEEDADLGIKLLKTRTLPQYISINNIAGKEKFLFMYDAITGNAKYFYKEGDIFIPLVSTGVIDINIGFKQARTGVFAKTIKYYPNTYITDY